MKLNNKGFAITSVLYGLLILFVVMMSSYLTVLSAKKNRLDNITKEIEDNYNFKNKEEIDTIGFPYTAPYTGKYDFGSDCTTYLYKGKEINSFEELNFTKDGCTSSNKATVYYREDKNDD